MLSVLFLDDFEYNISVAIESGFTVMVLIRREKSGCNDRQLYLQLSSVVCGTIIKYLLAEFNDSEPEVYAHHKAVRDLIKDENLRDLSLVDVENSSCEWILEHADEETVCQTEMFINASCLSTRLYFWDLLSS